MSKVVGYVFVSPNYINAEEAKNIHLFMGYYDDQIKRIFLDENSSFCGKCSVKKSWMCLEFVYGKSVEDMRKKARKIAEDFEDEGKTVCGQCVSKLYGDDI